MEDDHAAAKGSRTGGSKPPKTALIYLRVSTKEQAVRHGSDDGYSLPTQRAEANRKAKALDALVLEEYIDKDTGTSTDKRPAMRRLLDDLRTGQHEVDYVIVPKLDRWARNARDDLNADFVLEMAGAALVSCSETIDRSASGRLMHTLLASVNEYHSRNLSDEVKRKTLAKAKAGGTPYGAPTGYLNVQKGIDVRFVEIDEERAPHVRWAFEAYASGEWTLDGLTAALEERGLLSKGTKKRTPSPLVPSNVLRMLRNPYYKGLVRFRGVEYEGTHEALVTRALWQRVQDILDSRRAGEKQREHPHYLKGTVFCGHCESRLCVSYSRGRHGKQYPYFFCLGRQHHRTTCELKARRIELVERQVENLYAKLTTTADVLQQLREVLVDELTAERKAAQQTRVLQERRGRDLEAERRKLLELHYADAIPMDLFAEEQARITRELTQAAEDSKAALASIDTIERRVKDALKFASDCHRMYLASKPSIRRQINQAIFEGIWITESGISRYELAEPLKSLDSLGTYLRTAPISLLGAALSAEERRRILNEQTPDENVGGSKELALVGDEGLEPPTLSV